MYSYINTSRIKKRENLEIRRPQGGQLVDQLATVEHVLMYLQTGFLCSPLQNLSVLVVGIIRPVMRNRCSLSQREDI